MTSNPEPIVQQLQDEFQNLLAYVTGPDARAQTAYSVESTLFRRLLALGAALLRLFFVTRATVRPAEPAIIIAPRLAHGFAFLARSALFSANSRTRLCPVSLR